MNNIDDHQQGICPVCGSANIDYDAAEVDDGGVYYPAECNICHTQFNECYDLTFVGHYNIIKEGEDE